MQAHRLTCQTTPSISIPVSQKSTMSHSATLLGVASSHEKNLIKILKFIIGRAQNNSALYEQLFGKTKNLVIGKIAHGAIQGWDISTHSVYQCSVSKYSHFHFWLRLLGERRIILPSRKDSKKVLSSLP